MKFLSTRGCKPVNSSAEAITYGLASDGGLYVPERFPNLSNTLKDMLDMPYYQRAFTVISSYLEEYNSNDLLEACKNAYSLFDNLEPAPLVKIDKDKFIMELFHGPTLAFKDVALTLLPYLLRMGADICGKEQKILILVATSGDTGKAALEGFKNKAGISIIVFYPSEGVSDMQKMQMQTQEGDNVQVVGVKGNFDDCQNAVKRIFSNKQFNAHLLEKNVILSSANSINFGRLVPQISYYFSAYCDLVNSGDIKLGEKINFVVPTGNFGNILAGYYAKQMGLPINKLICASNSNNVLTEFICEGNYDANREFFKTISPSMDILISSNLERLIFELSGRDADKTAIRMKELKECGKYSIEQEELLKLNQTFYADYCEEQECLETIYNVFEDYDYVSDTHTAVALACANNYWQKTNDKTLTVILSTASPYKFSQSVLLGLKDKAVADAFKASEMLYEYTALEIPEQIKQLKDKPIRFNKVIDKNSTENAVLEFIDE